MSDDTVFMMVSRHGSIKTYHLNRDCRTLKAALKNKESACGYAHYISEQPPIREITQEEAEVRGLRLCQFCDPDKEIQRSEHDTSALQALKRAAKSD